MSKQQQSLQTEREPDMETEIDCPRCYDIITLSYDFDKLYYFCEECSLSLLIIKGDEFRYESTRRTTKTS
jgi:hypothetical protein